MGGLALSVRQASQTFDEPCHIFAGLQYWRHSDFGVNPEHPPLVKWLATLPLLPLRLQYPRTPEAPFKQQCWSGGQQLLYSKNGDDLLFRARMAASGFALLLALLVFEASYRMFGAGPAIIAMALLVFEPNILAHGALVTTDMGVTCCLFAAVYAFYRYVEKPSILLLLESGFTTGLTLAAKHSGILVFPILVSLSLAAPLRAPGRCSGPESQIAKNLKRRAQQVLRLAGPLLATAVIAVMVLWACYAFRFQARPDNQKMVPSLPQHMQELSHSGLSGTVQRRIILWLAHTRVLPESYLYGLADVAIRSGSDAPCFIFGRLYPRGHWFYFPAVFAVKSTIGFLFLLLLTPAPKGLRLAETRREILFMVIPAALYFAVSVTSRLNIGVRHILPVYPFLVVLAAASAWTLIRQKRRWRYVVIALLGVHALSSARSFPNYIAYSNEAWGGPTKTYLVLTDSNVDWGQGLKAAKQYLDRHRITECWMAYFGEEAGYYHIPCRPLYGTPASSLGQETPQNLQGTVLIGATTMVLSGPPELNAYQQFFRVKPVDVIAGCILVFQGQFDFTLGSALGHLRNARMLAARGQLDLAIAEAQRAVDLTPRSAEAHQALGNLFARANRLTDARREYHIALSLARTIQPEFQRSRVLSLEKELATM